ncbi:hypothetical protein FQN53_000314 [Emmonsiellopsis sp. PD_33]|nr:hypothetical protein FQN53_000314 [Emmonsiellopsis sp. PD_33]
MQPSVTIWFHPAIGGSEFFEKDTLRRGGHEALRWECRRLPLIAEILFRMDPDGRNFALSHPHQGTTGDGPHSPREKAVALLLLLAKRSNGGLAD